MAETMTEFQAEPIGLIAGAFPLYAAIEDMDGLIQHMADNDLGIAYVLGQEKDTITETYKINHMDKKHTYTKQRPKLFKVTVNIMGQSVVAVDDTDLGLPEIENAAWFSLPSIPYELITKIDNFFRYIYEKKKTEAIIVFVYDDTYLNSESPSDGWGFVVPDQENTGASCDYDQTTILDELPDDYSHITQVGTAHSHPNMGAYCSGTDKGDQTFFDGIHITFGWMYGKATEFHIEFQRSGKAFTFLPKDIFTQAPKASTDPEIERWAEKVKIKPAVTHQSQHSSTTQGSTYDHKLKEKIEDTLPEICPDPRKATVVFYSVSPMKDIADCPVCDSVLGLIGKKRFRCNSCMVFIVPSDYDLDDIIKARDAEHGTSSVEITPSLYPPKDIWFCTETWDQTAGFEVEAKRIYTATTSKAVTPSGKAEGGRDSALSSYDVFTNRTEYGDEDPLLCLKCGAKNAEQSWQCDICEGYDFALASSNPIIEDDQIIYSLGESFLQEVDDVLDEYNSHLDDIYYDDISAEGIQTIKDTMGLTWCLTCDESENKCECELSDRLLLDDVLAWAFSAGEEIYAQVDPQDVDTWNNTCENCVFAFSNQCLPLRRWARNFAQNETYKQYPFETQPEDGGLLKRCSQFRSTL